MTFSLEVTSGRNSSWVISRNYTGTGSSSGGGGGGGDSGNVNAFATAKRSLHQLEAVCLKTIRLLHSSRGADGNDKENDNAKW